MMRYRVVAHMREGGRLYLKSLGSVFTDDKEQAACWNHAAAHAIATVTEQNPKVARTEVVAAYT